MGWTPPYLNGIDVVRVLWLERLGCERKADFKREHPCPANGHRSGPCPGYVIDHIVPFACTGADAPSNMQWQTTADAKAKDKWERNCQLWLPQ